MINTLSWNVRLKCGKELRGVQEGSFANIKHRSDLVDLWVMSGAGRVHAENRGNPIGFDFYVHVTIEDGGPPMKYWKLITKYQDRTIIKHVQRDGRTRVEIKWLSRTTT